MREQNIDRIRALPDKLAKLVDGLTDEQLTTHYLEGEWTVAQNVHHLVDSHSNSYVRCKRIATEDYPTLRGYDQDAWADLPEAQSADISYSMAIIRGLHTRWTKFFDNLTEEQWARKGYHSEAKKDQTLEILAKNYANHGEEHLDQIMRTLKAGGITPASID